MASWQGGWGTKPGDERDSPESKSDPKVGLNIYPKETEPTRECSKRWLSYLNWKLRFSHLCHHEQDIYRQTRKFVFCNTELQRVVRWSSRFWVFSFFLFSHLFRESGCLPERLRSKYWLAQTGHCAHSLVSDWFRHGCVQPFWPWNTGTSNWGGGASGKISHLEKRRSPLGCR